MNRARQWLLHLLGIILLVSLLGAAVSISFNRTLGTPEKVERLLADSKIYDQLAGAFLTKSQEENNQGVGDSSVTYTNDELQAAANQAFAAEELQKHARTFIQANYDWLSGKTAQPEFSIDLSASKDDFAKRAGRLVSDRLSGLQACTPEQQAQLQIPVDPLGVPCRPANLDPKTEGERVTREINTGNFLSQANITPENLGQDQNNPQNPYYKNLSNAPKFYQAGQKAPWLLGGLAVLMFAAIVLLASPRRRGWRKTGILLLVAGILLIGSKLVADALVNNMVNKTTLASVTADGEFNQARERVLQQLEADLTQTNTMFGVIYIGLALALLAYLFTTRNKQPADAKLKPGSDTDKFESPSLLDGEVYPRLKPPSERPPRPPREPIAGPPPAPSQPQAQKPRRRKPPRLIQ